MLFLESSALMTQRGERSPFVYGEEF